MREPEEPTEKKSRRWRPAYTAMLASLVTGAVLAAGIARTDAGQPRPFSAFVFAVAVGAAVGFFEAGRLYGMWAGTGLGLIVGAASSLDLLAQPIDGMYAIVSATMAFFAVLGAALGAFVDLVRWLHRASHGIPVKREKIGAKR